MVSALESQTCICAVCGKKFKNLSGLKIHKAKICKNKRRDPSIVEKLDAIVNAVEVEVKEVVDTPVQEVVPESEVEVEKEYVDESAKGGVKESVKESVTVSESFLDTPKPLGPPIEDPPVDVPLTKADTPMVAPTSASKAVEQPEASTEANVYVNPLKIGIKAVTIDSEIQMYGSVFQLVNGSYVSVQAPSEPGKVTKIFKDPQGIDFLEVLVGKGTYTIPEHVVIPPDPNIIPEFRLVKLGREKKTVQQPKLDRNTYLMAVQTYANARDEAAKYEKDFKEKDKQNRPIILEYVSALGKAKDGYPGSNFISDGGYDVFYSFKEGAEVVERDDDIIIDYLMENGFGDAVMVVTQHKINEDVWKELKDSGKIPKEFIDRHDKVSKGKPSRRLYVEKTK
jgi:hypothetical protein